MKAPPLSTCCDHKRWRFRLKVWHVSPGNSSISEGNQLVAFKGQIFAGQVEKDPEITALIGMFVARWSLAEYSLMLAYLVAINSTRQEEATTVLAATNSTEAKIKIVLKLLDIAPITEVRRNAIRNAVKQLSRLCEARNNLMHHLWCHRDNGETVTIDYREPDNAKKQTVRSADDLRALCNAVVDATHAISLATGSSWIDGVAAVELKI